jgi:tetratricopeptide (TPR) repeat protein
LLDGSTRVVFDRLGVFAGSFDVDGAAAVAGDEAVDRFDVLDALAELVGKSMVVLDESDARTSRYRLLETMRQYALEQLDARGETDDRRRRHAGHYAAFAEIAGPHLVGRDEIAWRARIRSETDNLRVAVGWSLDRGEADDAELAMRIIAALMFETVGSRGSGIGEWAERAVAIDATASSPRRSSVLVVAAYGAFHGLDFDRAEAHARASLAGGADLAARAMADSLLGNVLMSTGNPVAAARHDVDALARLDAAGDAGWAALALIPAALFATFTGDPDRGAHIAADLLARARDLQWPTGIAMTQYAVAHTCALAQRDLDRALAAADESIALTESGASDVVYGHCFITRGLVHNHTGDYLAAARDLRRAVEYSAEIGDQVEVGSAISLAVTTLSAMGRHEDSVALAHALLAGPLQYVPVGWGEDINGIFDTALLASREALDPGAFERASQRGIHMEMDELVRCASTALGAIEATLDV